MFESLSQRLSATVNRLRGRGRLTEENIREALREVRIALLEADVALPVVQALVERVKVRAVGQEVLKSLSPGQALVKVVSDELTAVMGTANTELNLAQQPPAVVLMAGLQGAGKTTTVAKLARFLTERKKKKVMVVSCDVYRPAAIEQLRTLAEQVGVKFFPSEAGQNPVDIAKNAMAAARREVIDVLLVDTAGRLHVDEAMMAEIKALHAAITPVETLFVVDSMTGQDAANTAKAFAEALPLTGVVLTKTDGDARGGAALSVRYVTGRPIKFLGAGEKTDALEPFHPDRVAQRILGMGDVLSLVEEVERKVDQEKAQKLAEKVIKGKRFDLNDMRDQLEQMNNMGGLAGLMDKLPGVSALPENVKSKVNDGEIKRMVAIIQSMTKKERRHPDLLNGSRRARVARGSGTQPADVNRLLKQYMQMEKMMSKLSKGGTKGLLRQMRGAMKGMGGMGGGFPPDALSLNSPAGISGRICPSALPFPQNSLKCRVHRAPLRACCRHPGNSGAFIYGQDSSFARRRQGPSVLPHRCYRPAQQARWPQHRKRGFLQSGGFGQGQAP
ncbi:signal recognition particle protein [Dyella terrae]|nr:signal recognition particle protein [Dyella terrae]